MRPEEESSASQILTAMEISANKTATEYSRYGSDQFKQVYIYGGLDRSPTTLTRSFGFSWGLGGWLLTPFIGKIGHERFGELRKKVADEIDTTFKSKYTKTISLKRPCTEKIYFLILNKLQEKNFSSNQIIRNDRKSLF